MDNRETPAEYKDKFQLIFVGMFWSDDPRYETWTEGRIEIRTMKAAGITDATKSFVITNRQSPI